MNMEGNQGSQCAQSLTTDNLHDLVLPALACLPTAFISARPPPGFVPLLSPILRQRVHLSSNSSDGGKPPSQRDTWLSLLTWSRDRATELVDVVSRMQLEAHPVSGEIELFGHSAAEDDGNAWYRQLDIETVQARCNLYQHQIAFIWVWCSDDTGGTGLEALSGEDTGEAQSAWKIAEVLPLQDEENLEAEGWSRNLDAAQDKALNRKLSITNGVSHSIETPRRPSIATTTGGDDDYWAAYDRTPGNVSRNPSTGNVHERGQLNRVDSSDYFARYGNEVQPAMDAHDPDEDIDDRDWRSAVQCQPNEPTAVSTDTSERRDPRRQSRDRSATLRPDDLTSYGLVDDNLQKASPATQGPFSKPVMALEASAANADAVETTVRQHISGEIKHLYRLARGVGIDHEDFRTMVERETELLGLLGLDN